MQRSPFWAVLIGAMIGGFAAVASAQLLTMSDKVFEYVEQKYDRAARERVEAWHLLMLESSRRDDWDDLHKANLANDFFNQVRWVEDLEHWGVEDYWATPIETLATNAGDCEDFSIGKYFTLNAGGVDPDKLRITYVKALDYNQAHMVLAYYESPEAEPLILDNINKRILPASERTDLQPVYSFNADGLWLARSRNSKLNVDSRKSLPQWHQVNERIMQEIGR